MTKKINDWKVGYNSSTGKFVPVPLFGDRSYKDVKAECDRLNKIKMMPGDRKTTKK